MRDVVSLCGARFAPLHFSACCFMPLSPHLSDARTCCADETGSKRCGEHLVLACAMLRCQSLALACFMRGRTGH
eukprot:13005259-Alexandrium_andersonii.AAC.1